MSRKVIQLLFFSLFLFPFGGWGQDAIFIENHGQWPEQVLFDTRMPGVHVFVERDGLTFLLTDQADLSRGHDLMHQKDLSGIDPELLLVDHFSYKLQFLGAKGGSPKGIQPTSYYENYFRGKDPDRWVGGAPSFKELLIQDIYPGVDLRLFYDPNGLKYDLIVSDPSSIHDILWEYEGPGSARIDRKGNIELSCGFTQVWEKAPMAYDGSGNEIPVQYDSQAEGFRYSFKDVPEEEIVIDPQFIFSSFSGSTGDNFGFTATYDHDGNTYGGGITYGVGYPVTTGAFQTNFGAGYFDVTISKFNTSGTSLLFSTYLGSGNQEQPHSMIVDSQNQLLVFGVTGSVNFPVTPNAYDTTFNGGTFANLGITTYQNGTDLFVSKFSSDGQTLLQSTFLGGSGNDGVNGAIIPNYGDFYRGEIVLDTADQVYIASCTYSTDFPVVNANQPSPGGSVDLDGVILKLDDDLSQLIWSTYHGGSANEAAFSLKEDAGKLFVTGVTEGGNFPSTPGAYQSTFQGSPTDAFVLRYNSGSGALDVASFVGTSGEDLGFFVEVDPFGDVYLFGQTKGNFPISSGVWGVPGSNQFIMKMDRGLSTRLLSTTFGDTLGGNAFNIAPTAFMVDSCRNIYLSGWGGNVNFQGSTNGLFVTPNAFQSQTDGSDFYFLVLDGSWAFPEYATFFGGQSGEHVDGGTSRFSRDGTIHQAICAGCGRRSFPTFPSNVYGPTNGSQNCNMACVKIHFDYGSPDIDVTLDPDTACVPYTLELEDRSTNVDVYYWDFGDGTTDTSLVPNKVYTQTGTYSLTLIAVDTLCQRYDTATVELFLISDAPQAGFIIAQDTCGPPYTASFSSLGNGNDLFFWDFGDGNTDTSVNPFHSFPGPGTYSVTQVVTSILCGTSDTVVQEVSFYPEPGIPEIKIEFSPCSSTTEIQLIALASGYQFYFWDLGDGSLDTGMTIQHRFPGPGNYVVQLTVEDTLCGVTTTISRNIEVLAEFDPGNIFPNVFTPNNDGVNDHFTFLEPELASRFGNFTVRIFNRWGVQVFETTTFAVPWDGKFDGRDIAEGVYFWILELNDPCEGTDEYHGIVHLNR
ncbi:MAG: PKD domain-containing protein [Bacteroidota bacterium]|nr:PKD domain-containing protein [Bacteroidota bacterium]